MNGSACPEDLLVREGQDALSTDRVHALKAHVATCPLCRMSAAVCRAVRPLPPIDDQDDAMARRLVERQMKSVALVKPLPRTVPLPSRSNRWRLSRTVAIAAGVLLMASVASAAYWTVRVHVRAARQAAAGRAQTVAAVAAKTAPRRSSGAPAGTTPELAPPAPAAPAPVLALADSPPAPAPVPASVRAPAAASLDPEALLSGANEARRVRHAGEAIRDYRALQARFPTSREAVLSHLSLGNLYLAQGAFADAVAQFQAYIRGCEATPSNAPRGDGTGLAEEALLGEARALAALGRADDERAVWRTLETRFPRSEYLWRARQRLHELDRGATP